MPERVFFSILSSDLPLARDWYVALFGYRVEFDSDWFVHLIDPKNSALEVGIIDKHHQIAAARMRQAPVGGLLTVVVDDVDFLHKQAQASGVKIIEEPTNLFYGQRRMLIADPDGQIIDVSSECEPDPAWLATINE